MQLESVLGIDAAWTNTEPSGVALLMRETGRWGCVRVASSCEAFCDEDATMKRPKRFTVDVPRLLGVCQQLCDGARPRVVAVDMPVGRTLITTRRAADNRVSRGFGHAHCSTHSPSERRPGAIGVGLVDGFARQDYKLHFQGKPEPHALIEVYPHVALLALMSSPQRLPYKVGKTNKYWTGESLSLRRRNLLEEWHAILVRLREHIDGIGLALPPEDSDLSLAQLKPYEDSLDALICAWVATLYIDDAARALGDTESAIWIPSTSMQFAKEAHGT